MKQTILVGEVGNNKTDQCSILGLWGASMGGWNPNLYEYSKPDMLKYAKIFAERVKERGYNYLTIFEISHPTVTLSSIAGEFNPDELLNFPLKNAEEVRPFLDECTSIEEVETILF